MMNRSEYEMKLSMSPLKRLYNIEKTLFPDMEKIKDDVDNFEKILIEIYRTIEDNERMRGNA